MNSVETHDLTHLPELLRETMGKELTVIDYKSSSLLPAGENYMSSMIKVDAVIKRNKDAPEEELKLVAKMLPTAEFQRNSMHAATIFGKEIFMYEKLSRAYREIEEKYNSDDVSDLFPKFYGARLSVNKENSKNCDSDTVLLLENVKVLGYDTMDRRKGLDYDHAKLALRELARYHALGLGLKKYNPKVYEEAETYMKGLAFEVDDKEFGGMAEHAVNDICQDPRMAPYEDRIRKNAILEKDYSQSFLIEPVEPWATIIHGDFWVNNIMFRHGKNGKVDAVKFVDLQMSRVASPLSDITFIEVLRKIGVDDSAFTKSNFKQDLNRVAKKDLLRTFITLKLFTLEVTEDVDMSDVKNSILLGGGGSKAYLDRIWNVISLYIENEWF